MIFRLPWISQTSRSKCHMLFIVRSVPSRRGWPKHGAKDSAASSCSWRQENGWFEELQSHIAQDCPHCATESFLDIFFGSYCTTWVVEKCRDCCGTEQAHGKLGALICLHASRQPELSLKTWGAVLSHRWGALLGWLFAKHNRPPKSATFKMNQDQSGFWGWEDGKCLGWVVKGLNPHARWEDHSPSSEGSTETLLVGPSWVNISRLRSEQKTAWWF